MLITPDTSPRHTGIAGATVGEGQRTGQRGVGIQPRLAAARLFGIEQFNRQSHGLPAVEARLGRRNALGIGEGDEQTFCGLVV